MPVLDVPAFSLAAGSVVGITGPSGSGKTSFLHVIAGIERPSTGRVRWGATDVTGRLFEQKFSELWGQPVVVENIAGNAGAIGVDRVAKAAPDGYTLMWTGNAAVTILPSMQALPFHPDHVFTGHGPRAAGTAFLEDLLKRSEDALAQPPK